MSTVDAINATGAVDYIEYPQGTGVDKVEGADESDSAFAQLLEEALKEFTNNSMTDNFTTGSLTGQDPMSMSGSLLMPSLNSTMEQAIMKASSTGSKDDAMIALLMLMMMMESGGSGGESGMMMQMMAAMVGQMQDQDKNTLRNDFMYSSGGSPYTLDTMDEQVFDNYVPKTIPTVSEGEEAELPLEWWRPTVPVLISTSRNRDPALYRAVVNQFNVETAERYRPGREGHTYCNVYVWDVTRAMGAELPYYSDPETGAPREYPDVKGANYNGAIAMDRWLKTHGEKYGWHQATAEEAQMHANQGKPAVTAAGDIGHVQMVVPSENGQFDPIRGVTIAQAGSKVSNYMHISGIYGSNALTNKVTYWIHD